MLERVLRSRRLYRELQRERAEEVKAGEVKEAGEEVIDEESELESEMKRVLKKIK